MIEHRIAEIIKEIHENACITKADNKKFYECCAHTIAVEIKLVRAFGVEEVNKTINNHIAKYSLIDGFFVPQHFKELAEAIVKLQECGK